MEFRLIPGFFGDSAAKTVETLLSDRVFVVSQWQEPGVENSDLALPSRSAQELATWLLEFRRGERRALEARGSARGASGLSLGFETEGARARRILVALRATLPKESSATWADLEIILLGIACAALATEDQGAVLIGEELGPLSDLDGEGTVSEQVQRFLVHGSGFVSTIVAAPGTAASIGDLPGFDREPLGNLACFRAKPSFPED